MIQNEQALRVIFQHLFEYEIAEWPNEQERRSIQAVIRFNEGDLVLVPDADISPRQLAPVFQVVTSWYWLTRRVLETIVFSQREEGADVFKVQEGGWLETVFTQHPNTPHPSWVLDALQHAASYIEMATTKQPFDESGLKDKLTPIISELCHRAFEEKTTPNVLTNLSQFLLRYRRKIWRNAHRFWRRYSTWMVVDTDGMSAQALSSNDIVEGARMLRNCAIDLYQEVLNTIHEQLSRIDTPWARELESEVSLTILTLTATRRGFGADNGFVNEEHLRSQLRRLTEKATQHGAQLAETFWELERKAEVFGITFLSMQPRVHRDVVRTLCEEVFLHLTGSDLPDDEAQREDTLKKLIMNGVRATFTEEEQELLSEPSQWMVSLLNAFADVAPKNGRLEKMVLANTEVFSDELALEWLLIQFKLPEVEVVTLFENESGLACASEIVGKSLDWRKERGRSFYRRTMFGYSDTQRNLGTTGWFAIANAMADAQRVAQSRGGTLEMFYGRARSFFRGGRRFDHFRQAMPDSNPSCMVLVQGDDTLENRLTESVADRSRARLWEPVAKTDPALEEPALPVVQELQYLAQSHFKKFVASAEFRNFFAVASPILYVRQFNRSVRPDQRAGGVASSAAAKTTISWDAQRAIGTVQSGLICGYVPQLFGAGLALQTLCQDEAKCKALQSLFHESVLFRYWFENQAREYSRVDLQGLTELAYRAKTGKELIARLEDDLNMALDAWQKISGQPRPAPGPTFASVSVMRSYLCKVHRECAGHLPTSGPLRNAALRLCQSILAGMGENG